MIYDVSPSHYVLCAKCQVSSKTLPNTRSPKFPLPKSLCAMFYVPSVRCQVSSKTLPNTRSPKLPFPKSLCAICYVPSVRCQVKLSRTRSPCLPSLQVTKSQGLPPHKSPSPIVPQSHGLPSPKVLKSQRPIQLSTFTE